LRDQTINKTIENVSISAALTLETPVPSVVLVFNDDSGFEDTSCSYIWNFREI